MSTDKLMRNEDSRKKFSYFETIMNKYENRNRDLEEQEKDLRIRLDVFQRSFPILMFWNMSQIMQGTNISCADVISAVSNSLLKGERIRGEVSKEVNQTRRDRPLTALSGERRPSTKLKEIEEERAQMLEDFKDAENEWKTRKQQLQSEVLALECKTKPAEKELQTYKQNEEKYKRRIRELENVLYESEKYPEELDVTFVFDPNSGVATYNAMYQDLQNYGIRGVPSLNNKDLQTMKRLQELVHYENASKKRITEMEKKEKAYLEMWSDMESPTSNKMQIYPPGGRNDLGCICKEPPISDDEDNDSVLYNFRSMETNEKEYLDKVFALEKENKQLLMETNHLRKQLQELQSQLEERRNHVEGLMKTDPKNKQGWPQKLDDNIQNVERDMRESSRINQKEVSILQDVLHKAKKDLKKMERINKELNAKIESLLGEIKEKDDELERLKQMVGSIPGGQPVEEAKSVPERPPVEAVKPELAVAGGMVTQNIPAIDDSIPCKICTICRQNICVCDDDRPLPQQGTGIAQAPPISAAASEAPPDLAEEGPTAGPISEPLPVRIEALTSSETPPSTTSVPPPDTGTAPKIGPSFLYEAPRQPSRPEDIPCSICKVCSLTRCTCEEMKPKRPASAPPAPIETEGEKEVEAIEVELAAGDRPPSILLAGSLSKETDEAPPPEMVEDLPAAPPEELISGETVLKTTRSEETEACKYMCCSRCKCRGVRPSSAPAGMVSKESDPCKYMCCGRCRCGSVSQTSAGPAETEKGERPCNICKDKEICKDFCLCNVVQSGRVGSVVVKSPSCGKCVICWGECTCPESLSLSQSAVPTSHPPSVQQEAVLSKASVKGSQPCSVCNICGEECLCDETNQSPPTVSVLSKTSSKKLQITTCPVCGKCEEECTCAKKQKSDVCYETSAEVSILSKTSSKKLQITTCPVCGKCQEECTCAKKQKSDVCYETSTEVTVQREEAEVKEGRTEERAQVEEEKLEEPGEIEELADVKVPLSQVEKTGQEEQGVPVEEFLDAKEQLDEEVMVQKPVEEEVAREKNTPGYLRPCRQKCWGGCRCGLQKKPSCQQPPLLPAEKVKSEEVPELTSGTKPDAPAKEAMSSETDIPVDPEAAESAPDPPVEEAPMAEEVAPETAENETPAEPMPEETASTTEAPEVHAEETVAPETETLAEATSKAVAEPEDTFPAEAEVVPTKELVTKPTPVAEALKIEAAPSEKTSTNVIPLSVIIWLTVPPSTCGERCMCKEGGQRATAVSAEAKEPEAEQVPIVEPPPVQEPPQAEVIEELMMVQRKPSIQETSAEKKSIKSVTLPPEQPEENVMAPLPTTELIKRDSRNPCAQCTVVCEEGVCDGSRALPVSILEPKEAIKPQVAEGQPAVSELTKRVSGGPCVSCQVCQGPCTTCEDEPIITYPTYLAADNVSMISMKPFEWLEKPPETPSETVKEPIQVEEALAEPAPVKDASPEVIPGAAPAEESPMELSPVEELPIEIALKELPTETPEEIKPVEQPPPEPATSPTTAQTETAAVCCQGLCCWFGCTCKEESDVAPPPPPSLDESKLYAEPETVVAAPPTEEIPIEVVKAPEPAPPPSDDEEDMWPRFVDGVCSIELCEDLEASPMTFGIPLLSGRDVPDAFFAEDEVEGLPPGQESAEPPAPIEENVEPPPSAEEVGVPLPPAEETAAAPPQVDAWSKFIKEEPDKAAISAGKGTSNCSCLGPGSPCVVATCGGRRTVPPTPMEELTPLEELAPPPEEEPLAPAEEVVVAFEEVEVPAKEIEAPVEEAVASPEEAPVPPLEEVSSPSKKPSPAHCEEAAPTTDLPKEEALSAPSPAISEKQGQAEVPVMPETALPTSELTKRDSKIPCTQCSVHCRAGVCDGSMALPLTEAAPAEAGTAEGGPKPSAKVPVDVPAEETPLPVEEAPAESTPEEVSNTVVQEASELQTAMSVLEKKCQNKNQIIAALATELKVLAESSQIDQLCDSLAADSSEPLQDFDRDQLCEFLRKSDGSPSKVQPKQQSERVVCPRVCPGAVNRVDTSIPPPLGLHVLCRVGPNGLMLGWSNPHGVSFVGYEVFVNGALKQKVHSSTRNKAVLQNVDLSKKVIISLYGVTTGGACSQPASIRYPDPDVEIALRITTSCYC